MNPAIWMAIGVGGALVIAFLLWWFWPQGGCDHSCKEPKYQADHADPTKRWIHGVLALYRGDVGDPAYWDAECVERQTSGWGMKQPADMTELLVLYRDGDVNHAFDKARLIWVARLGEGKGWLSPAQSWQWCVTAATALRQHYHSWNQMFQELDQGRIAWYDGQMPPEERERAKESYRFASNQVLPQIPYR